MPFKRLMLAAGGVAVLIAVPLIVTALAQEPGEEDALRDRVLYTPGDFGFEKEVAKRLAWWQELRERAAGKKGGVQPAKPE